MYIFKFVNPKHNQLVEAFRKIEFIFIIVNFAFCVSYTIKYTISQPTTKYNWEQAKQIMHKSILNTSAQSQKTKHIKVT